LRKGRGHEKEGRGSAGEERQEKEGGRGTVRVKNGGGRERRGEGGKGTLPGMP